MVSDQQPPLDKVALAKSAGGFGLGLTMFQGWDVFVDQVLFWSGLPKPVAATQTLARVHERLAWVEATTQALDRWRAVVAESNRHGAAQPRRLMSAVAQGGSQRLAPN